MPLALVSATYDYFGWAVTLVFNQAIDISGFMVTEVTVSDAEHDQLWDAENGANLLDPVTVQIGLLQTGEATGPGVTMSASAANGIVAVDGGEPWVGCTDLGLPFP